jgi:transposase
MCPIAYFTMTRSKDHSFDVRVHLVRHAIAHGIHAASRAFQASRNTVRKWLRRFQAAGWAGLAEQSRAPKSCPHKTTAAVEKQVLAQRARTPGFGARRLKREFALAPSVGAIARILRQHGLTRRRKRKHQTKRDLRAVKARYAPLTHFHMDTKYLNDIPHFWPYLIGLGLPGYQYTIRCLKTGATFLAYGSAISATYAELTVRRLLEHLQHYGIDPKQIVIQTDSGSEFEGQTVRPKGHGFRHTIEQEFGAQHRQVCGNANANADVESFHAHEETEFFNIETFASRKEFWDKITTYQHYWNLGRYNSYKEDRTPLQILQEANPQLPPEVLLLAPLHLDRLTLAGLGVGVGHDVPVVPAFSQFFPEFSVGFARCCRRHPSLCGCL